MPHFFVLFGQKRRMSRKGPGSPFAVYTQLSHPALHLVCLHFGDIVANIIYKTEPQIPGPHLENILQGLSNPVGNQLAIAKSKIGCTGHG